MPHKKTGVILNNRYRILEPLGEGGFGITYRGWDEVLNVMVAVKEYAPKGLLFSAAREDDAEFQKGLDAFLREARIQSRFSQLEGIVATKDYFRENGTGYLVMDFAGGTSVGAYVKSNGKMDSAQVLEGIRPVFYALSEIHENNMVHRDVSADNLMIAGDGRMKLIDFGATRKLPE